MTRRLFSTTILTLVITFALLGTVITRCVQQRARTVREIELPEIHFEGKP